MCSRSVRTRPASCTCCRRAAASTGSRRLPKPPDAERHLNGNRPLEVAMQTRIRGLALAALAAAALVTPAFGLKGPPWISIELPVNPYDRTMQGAFLLVHAFHPQTPIGFPIEGTAEGMVNGERRTVKLEFSETSRDGVYALKRTWAEEGVWTLVIRVNQGPAEADGNTATAVVEIGSDGEVASVRVPTNRRG